jgi:hypothetical protein
MIEALIWKIWSETPYLCFAFVQVILILLFILIEVSRIFSGWKGNLTENVGRSQFPAPLINNSKTTKYVYIKSESPLVGIGTISTPPSSECAPPRRTGGAHSPAGEVGGVPIPTTGEKA